MFRDYCVSLRGIEPGTFIHGPESGVVLENAADHLDVAEKAHHNYSIYLPFTGTVHICMLGTRYTNTRLSTVFITQLRKYDD